MPQPPESVAFVARTFWLTGAVIVAACLFLFVATRNVRVVEFGARTYGICGGLGALYLVSGTLVWFGAPFGRILGRICALLFLPRPQLGSRLWEIMNSPEFRTHFSRSTTPAR